MKSTLPPDEVDRLVGRVREHYEQGCFACGLANPMGLHLDGFTVAGREVEASFSPRPHYRGIPGTLHGGIAATALDDILVWAGILTEGVMSVTGTIDLRYRAPVSVDATCRLRGRVDERRGRRLVVSGELAGADGPAVSATGLYLVSHPLDQLLGT